MNKIIYLYNHANKILSKILLTGIRIYQKTLSPDKGFFKDFFPNGYCKFTPHCSEYTYQAIKKHGALKGSLKGIWRILRCNPFSKGGNDPLK